MVLIIVKGKNNKHFVAPTLKGEVSMFVRDKKTSDLVEVLDISALIDPCVDGFNGRFHAGEEMQDPRDFAKADMEFPSGEALPRCWVDANYRN